MDAMTKRFDKYFGKHFEVDAQGIQSQKKLDFTEFKRQQKFLMESIDTSLQLSVKSHNRSPQELSANQINCTPIQVSAHDQYILRKQLEKEYQFKLLNNISSANSLKTESIQ